MTRGNIIFHCLFGQSAKQVQERMRGSPMEPMDFTVNESRSARAGRENND